MRNSSRNGPPRIRSKRPVFLVLAILLWLVLAVLIGGRMVDFGDRKTNNILSISLLLSVYFFWLYLPDTKSKNLKRLAKFPTGAKPNPIKLYDEQDNLYKKVWFDTSGLQHITEEEYVYDSDGVCTEQTLIQNGVKTSVKRFEYRNGNKITHDFDLKKMYGSHYRFSPDEKVLDICMRQYSFRFSQEHSRREYASIRGLNVTSSGVFLSNDRIIQLTENIINHLLHNGYSVNKIDIDGVSSNHEGLTPHRATYATFDDFTSNALPDFYKAIESMGPGWILNFDKTVMYIKGNDAAIRCTLATTSKNLYVDLT